MPTRRLHNHDHRRDSHVLHALAGWLFARVRLVKVRAKCRPSSLKERIDCDTAIDAWVRALDRPSRKAAYTARLKELMDAIALTRLHHRVDLVYRAGDLDC